MEEVGVRLTAPRAAHQREGHERFTLDRILAEEAAVLDLADARDDRAQLWVKDEDITGLSAQQAHALREIARSPWLVQPLSVPAGAGKTTALRALASAAHRSQRHCQVERSGRGRQSHQPHASHMTWGFTRTHRLKSWSDCST